MDISSSHKTDNTNIEDMKKATETKQQTGRVLEELNRIEKEEGMEIQEIKVGEMQISKNELSSKEIILEGNGHFYKKEYDEAIECYDRAMELDANNPEAWFDKGCALGKQKRYDEAIEWYDKAMEMKPDYAFGLNNKGNALDNLGRPGEAIEWYDKALEIEPDDAITLSNKGLALDKLGKHKETIESYDKALEINPNHADALYSKGIAQEELEKR